MTVAVPFAIILTLTTTIPILVMMTGLTTSAMLAVMVLHAAFGCCWHHDHGSCAGSKAGEASSTATCCHDHGHHQHEQSGEPAPHAPTGGETPDGEHDHGDCTSDLCRFVSSLLVEVPVAQIEWSGVVASDASSASLLAAAVLDARGASVDFSNGGSAPTLRLLAQLCVWRI